MATMTISDYLKGVVKSVSPDEPAIQTICLNAGIDDVSAVYSDLTERQQRLALAYLYLWIGLGPTTGSRWSEKDGDWSQSGSDGTFTRGQLWMYLRLAKDILSDYGIEINSNPVWGMRVGGFRNIRRGRRGRHI